MCAPSVDRIGSPSVTMISTASMEPGNPASAELSWKTVKKGYRSATRRPRKINQSLNVYIQDNDKGSEEEPSATESEEFGLAVLGHRFSFSEKIDHLPIKKRRSMQQPPSLPHHIPFQFCGTAGALVDGLVPVQTSSNNEKSVVNRKPPCSEETYGIELLAAAACSTSITDEILNVKEVKAEENIEALPQTADASSSATLSEETIAAAACNTRRSGEIFNVEAVMVEEKSEILPQSDGLINVTLLEETIICSQKQNSLLKDVSGVDDDSSQDQNSSLSIQVKSDDNICSQKQNLLVKDINSAAHDDSRDQNHYPVVSGDIHEKSDIICSQKQNSSLKDVKSVAHDDSGDQNSSPALSGNVHDTNDIICSQMQNSLLKDINGVAHVDSRDQNSSLGVSDGIHDESAIEVGKGSSTGKFVRLHWDLNTVMDDWELPPENMNTDSPRTVSVDVHGEGFPGGETEKLNTGTQQASKCSESGLSPGSDLVASETLFKEKINPTTTKMDVKVEENHILGSDLHLGQMLIVENVHLGKQDAAMVNPTISSNTNTIHLGTAFDVGGSCKSEKAGPSFGKGNSVRKIDINIPSEIDPPVETNKLDVKSCTFTGEAALEDFLDDGDISDYSPGGHYRFARFDKMSKYKSGCESPVEDGELRESIAHSWQEIEDETDFVDYDIDDRDAENDFAVGNNCVSKAGCSSSRIDSNEKLAQKVTSEENDFSKELNHSETTRKSSGWDQIPKGCERVTKTIEAKFGAFESSHKLDSKGSSDEKAGSRPTRGKISTRLQRFSGSGAFDGKDTRDGQRSTRASFQDGQVYRFDRHLGRDSLLSRMHDESQKNSQNGDLSRKWDSRNHYQNGYQRGGGNPRLRNNENPDANDNNLVYDDHHRHPRGNYLRGGYRSFVRRSPDDDNHNSPKRGNFATRDDSHYGSRGRPGFYRQGFVNGSRGEFHDPIADDWVPHNHSARRKYSRSPVYNRDTSFFRPSRKSPSQSRSRSPVPWHLQREKNGGRRQISRSPDFRSEGRMGIKRMRNDDPKFSENNHAFLSPPRRSFSNDRKSGPVRYKDRDSPGRFFGQRQRFGSNGTVERMGKDDDGFRPRLNSERFSEQSGAGWKANNNNNNNGNSNNNNNNYNDNSDSQRRRYNNKTEMIGRVRTGGTDRHFGNGADDWNGYNNNNKSNSCIRSAEKSDRLGNSWEEGKCLFKRDSDRIYTTSSKLHGIRDYECNASANRG